MSRCGVWCCACCTAVGVDEYAAQHRRHGHVQRHAIRARTNVATHQDRRSVAPTALPAMPWGPVSVSVCLSQLGCSIKGTHTHPFSLSQEPLQKSSRVTRSAKSRMRRTETPKPIWIKFCVVVDIPDVVTYTNFGDHRLRGFWVAGGSNFPLSH